MFRLVPSVCLTTLCGAALALGAAPPATSPAPSPAPTLTASPAPSPSPNPNSIDGLAPTDLEQALTFIKKNYVVPGALNAAELDRATLAGLLARLGRGVALRPANAARAAATPAPFYREILEGHIGYLRPAALRKNDLAELEKALHDFAADKVDAIILDLRAVEETSDYGKAADFAQRFVPRGENLFFLRGPGAGQDRTFVSEQSPIYNGFISVLIDEETAGASEVLASVLRARDKAILIGQPTAGAAVEYAELSLGNGMTLRVAVAQAILPEESSGFPRGVQPDLAVWMRAETKHQIFAESLSKGMASFVFEPERPHLNEAALLAGTNPEIEAIQASQQRRARGEKLPPSDPVAQRAIDVITSISIYAKPAGRTP